MTRPAREATVRSRNTTGSSRRIIELLESSRIDLNPTKVHRDERRIIGPQTMNGRRYPRGRGGVTACAE
jgi:hypothetical protein